MPEIKFNNNGNKQNDNGEEFFKDTPGSAPANKPKLFANKKANIALIIVGSLIVLAFVAALIIKYIPASALA